MNKAEDVSLDILRFIHVRKVRDSNPRNHKSSSTDFESAPIDHSGNFPSFVAKIICFYYIQSQ